MIVEENGDLLGHGVNVAARLQALAEPGSAMVSETVRAQLHTNLGLPFVAQGRVRLDKMSETIEVYSIAPGPNRFFTKLRRRRAARALFALLFVVGGALAALWLWQPGPNAPDRIAVAAFESLGSNPSNQVSEGVANAIVNSMAVSDLHVEKIGSRAPDRGATFLVGGSLHAESDTTLVDVRITDLSARTVLWSSQYRRPSSEVDALPDQVAAHVTDVLRCALVSRRPRAGPIAPDTLSTFLRACDYAANIGADPASAYEAARRVTQDAPSFSRGWSLLALICAEIADDAPPARGQTLLQEATDAATRALTLDPNNAEAQLARLRLLPRRNAFAQQQEILDRAVAAEPNSATVLAAQGEFEMSIGRVQDGLASYRRAAALDPTSPEIWADMIPILAASDRVPEAAVLRDRLARVWPNSAAAWWNRLMSALFWAAPRDGLRMLDQAELGPIPAIAEASGAWRPFLHAREEHDAAALRAAARNIVRLARLHRFDQTQAVVAASLSGEMDDAYALAFQYFDENPTSAETDWLFYLATRQLRADPRFIVLAHKTGLAAYWRATGRWPDFCGREAPHYDCRG